MTDNYKKVWKELEKNVGRCFFFKEGVVKEISGYATYTLTLATFAVPDRVKTYIDNLMDQSFDETIDVFQKEDRFALLSYLISRGILDIKVAYLHGEVKTLEGLQIIQE